MISVHKRDLTNNVSIVSKDAVRAWEGWEPGRGWRGGRGGAWEGC